MPRRKHHKIQANQTSIYDAIVEELSKLANSESFDMSTIEISVKEKITPQIKDVDQAIKNLERYIAINKAFIKTINGEAIVFKKNLARMLKISRPTLDKWIKNGFVTPVNSKNLPDTEIFPPQQILQQLINYKNKK